MGVGLTFIYLPLTVVVINSFNVSRTFSWPPRDFTTDWWTKAAANTGVREALRWSVTAGAIAAGLALLLGTCIAFAVSRYRFFGRETYRYLLYFQSHFPALLLVSL